MNSSASFHNKRCYVGHPHFIITLYICISQLSAAITDIRDDQLKNKKRFLPHYCRRSSL